MAEESEIDLYDNVDDNWKRESLDLYDDVESHSNDDIQQETKPNSQNNQSGRRVATYVGNLRWWTTDQDLIDSLTKLDIKDILEIKFHENRQNGQSKGFCVVVFGSDKSAKEAMEKLPKFELHGLAPIVTYCNKQNLNYFEQAAGGGISSGNNNNNNNNSNNNGGNKMKTDMNRNNNGSQMMCNNINQMQIGALGNNIRFPNNMCMPGLPGMSQNLLFNLSQYTQNTMNRTPNMMMQNSISTPLNVPSGQMNMSLAAQRLMQPGMMMQPNNNLQMPGSSGPTPHLNPNFFNAAQGGGMMNNMGINNSTLNQSSTNLNQYDAFGRLINNSFNQSGISPKLSDTEFEEILQRNKTVSSSAINRAVQDASAGDYASAIETLVTAISLIKQSKISADSRCKVLINSLQDTLTGIESKSYGSSRKIRTRRRSLSESSSEVDRDDNNEYGSRRILRSRSRDRRRRSRDYGRSSNQPTSNVVSNSEYFASSTDRYVNRYRH